MKIKAPLLVLLFTTLLIVPASATPIKQLEKGDLNVDFSIHDTNGKSNLSFAYKITDTLTVGVDQYKWTNGFDTDQSYAQFNFGPSMSIIVGNMDLDAKARSYMGLSLAGVINPEWDYNTSIITDKIFKEAQLGLNYKLSDDVKLNFNYRILNYQKVYDSFYWGVSYKFKLN